MISIAGVGRTRLVTLGVGAMLCLQLTAATAANQLTVRDAWARATPPGSGAAAVYVTIEGGAAPDRLVRVSTARAAMAQLHAVTTEAGMTRMREVTSVTIPAGKSIVFAPQGLHIMLMGLTQALIPGERFTLTLEFAAGNKRVVPVNVLAATATGPAAR